MSANAGDTQRQTTVASSDTSTTSGTITLLSGPSGCGKSSIIKRVMAALPELRFEVSCTTRDRRPTEAHGREYYFLTLAEFERKIQEGLFLEHALVHGNRYGTLLESVLGSVRKGEHVIMDIDVQGAEQVLNCEHPEIRAALVTCFVHPPSMEVLEHRLRSRKDCKSESIKVRLENAPGEIAKAPLFDFETVNGDLEVSVGEVLRMVRRHVASHK